MVKGLFIWEQSPGLEHHCPRCHTPLHNARAKNTCYFKHVEICSRFHQHFFLIGQSHTCATCRCNTEAHNQRHRDLAFLLRDLSTLQSSSTSPNKDPSSPFPSTPRRLSIPTNLLLLNNEDPSTTPSPIDGLKKRERKKAKKRIKALKGGDALKASELDFVVDALHPEGCSPGSCTPISSTTSTPMTEDQNDDIIATSSPSSSYSSSDDDKENCTAAKEDLGAVIAVHKAFHADVDGKLNKTRMSLQKDLLDSLSMSSASLASAVDAAMLRLGVECTFGNGGRDGCKQARYGKDVGKDRRGSEGGGGGGGGGGKKGEAGGKKKGKEMELKIKIREKVQEDLECWAKDWRNERIREAGWYRFVTRGVLAKGKEWEE